MVKTTFKIFCVWLLLALINYGLLALDIGVDTTVYFPISVFKLGFHQAGLIYGLLFSLVLLFASRFALNFKLPYVWIVGLLLIILGNLAQGGIEQGFYLPFSQGKSQYYHDALKIADWVQWLANFNENQETLLTHTRSHPPFAVLLHVLLLGIGRGDLLVLASGFTLLSSLSIALIWQILKVLNVPLQKRNLLTVLFSVVPAFNIYSCVSLDGIILTVSMLFLYGLLRLMKYGLHTQGLLFLFIGIVFSNTLTFSGVLFFLVLASAGVRDYLLKRKLHLLVLLGLALLLGVVLNELSSILLGYSHFRALLGAAALENPDGFRGFSEPVNYLVTRVENVTEIAFFFSFGLLAVLFHPKHLNSKLLDISDDWNFVTLAAIAGLLLMFLAGTFRTGETARACLFIYPYLLLAIRKLEHGLLPDLILFTGAQCLVMQLFGNYFW